MSGGDIAIDLLWEQIRLFVLRVAVLSSLHYFNEPPTSNATTITTTTAAAAAAAATTIVLHTISQLFYILEIGLEGAAFLYSLSNKRGTGLLRLQPDFEEGRVGSRDRMQQQQ